MRRAIWRPSLWWYIKRQRARLGGTPADALLTEAGAALTTEGGDTLILE